jgi:cell wall-associated NlpC family hydrolase
MSLEALVAAFDARDRRLDPAPDDWTAAKTGHVRTPLADLRRDPSNDCGIDSQLLHGTGLRILAGRQGWLRVQSLDDGYVGWTASTNVRRGTAQTTHFVSAPRSFVYPGPDLRFPAKSALSLGSAVHVAGHAETRGTAYALLATGGAMIAGHLRGHDATDSDPVAIAERLLGTPYLWGGSSAFGIDCSGLVQLCWRMCGVPLLRDSDMLAATFGRQLDADTSYARLKRGDLVFWKGHVAIVSGKDEIIHASGHAMLVVRESLSGAINRIARLYGQPTGFRRIAGQ